MQGADGKSRIRENGGKGQEVIAPKEKTVLKQDGNTDRGDERRQSRRLAQRFVREFFNADRGQTAHDDRGNKRHGKSERPGQRPCQRQRTATHKRTQHENFGMGEVDHQQNPVHHRVPERHQRVDGAQRETVDQLFKQRVDWRLRN